MSTESSSPDPNAIAHRVAIMFVKQYYKCLSTDPELLKNFYYDAQPGQQNSILSHGEGSELSVTSANHGHDRWGCGSGEKMVFDFNEGAIDAQPSMNDSVMIVLTASVSFTGGEQDQQRKKQFVQTFFLAKVGRNFAVVNDILRFLANNSEVALVSSPTASKSVQASFDSVNEEKTLVAKNPAPMMEPATIQDEKKTDPMEEKKASSGEDESSAPGGGVEESKEEAPEEEEAGANAKKRSNSKENKSKKNKGGKNNQQPAAAASKPTPGSWASLVVSGGSAPNTPSRSQEKKAPNPKAPSSSKQPPLPPSDDTKENSNGETTEGGSKKKDKSNNNAATTTPNGNAKASNNAKNEKSSNANNKKDKEQQQRTKRDPDNTLVIKNLSENIKEQDILNMFSPFAAQTKAKIVGTNLNHHRLLAFVDYDSVAPVMAALKKHKETPFEWNGKVLEIDQKTMEQRARRKAGGNNNNSNHNVNNNNGYRTANGGAGGRGGNNKRRGGTRAGR